ncbi:methyltransferase [Actinomyces trachealis]|uniref:DUF7059 domain-containing protein n=1 Tax=Actinomyces trachealis TaxID=2763540 RepID=UPI0018929F6E|nr:class I SAM-dependent methyltransferase [Actinomyces trachealis]
MPRATSSTPALATDPTRLRSLRADLETSGWGVDAVDRLLGPVASAALRREQRLPALRALAAHQARRREAGQGPDPVATLTALFMLGQPVAVAELDAALPNTGTAGALAMGLVVEAAQAAHLEGEPSSNPASRARARVLAAVDLRPHEATDAAGEVRWWVASDLGELETGRELAPNHVLGIGGAGLTLAALTPRRPVTTALDLGCGCGIQTLYLLRHCQHVTATDISARALAFTAFNTALAGVEPGRLELLQGSFLEPVAGRRFDLVATNPPFVITPPAVREAGLALLEYRDAGGPVLPTLVPGLGAHLAPGGIAVMLGNWEHHTGQDWRERVATWLPEDTDAWVVQRELQDPVEYASMWLRDGGSTPERDRSGFEARLGAWIDDFESRGVAAVGFGYLVLHRPEAGATRAPWRVLEEVTTTGTGPLGEHVAQVVEASSRLAAMDDDAVATLRPVAATDVTQERHMRPGDTEPTMILIRQGGGLGRVIQAGTALAALVDVADGELSVAQVATALAALGGQEDRSAALKEELVAATRELVRGGFLALQSCV